jgi:hypothetical protein
VSAVGEIRAAQARTLVDEDGGEVQLVLGPPASAEAVARLEDRCGAGLPRELREILAVTRSIAGPLEVIDFLGESAGVEVPGMPAALELAGDGFGNFWVADVTPEPSDCVPVFFACHDPPVVLLQSPTLGDFLHEVFLQLTPPHESLIDVVRDDRAFNVWGTDHGALTPAQALAAGGDVAAFAQNLDHSDYLIYDLRAASPGEGFAWGRARPDADVLRYGHQRLFAVDRRRPPPGRLRRLFTRWTPSQDR